MFPLFFIKISFFKWEITAVFSCHRNFTEIWFSLDYPRGNFPKKNIGQVDYYCFLSIVFEILVLLVLMLMFVGIIIFIIIFFFLDFTNPAILLLDFKHSSHLNQTFSIWNNCLLLRRYNKSDMLHMAGRQVSFFTALFFISLVFRDIASQQCHGIYSIYRMMLQGHTYKTFKTTTGMLECRETCLADDRCQSFNVVMGIAICELNNRNKEARPEDFVKDENRYYMAKDSNRGNSTCKYKTVGCAYVYGFCTTTYWFFKLLPS